MQPRASFLPLLYDPRALKLLMIRSLLKSKTCQNPCSRQYRYIENNYLPTFTFGKGRLSLSLERFQNRPWSISQTQMNYDLKRDIADYFLNNWSGILYNCLLFVRCYLSYSCFTSWKWLEVERFHVLLWLVYTFSDTHYFGYKRWFVEYSVDIFFNLQAH